MAGNRCSKDIVFLFEIITVTKYRKFFEVCQGGIAVFAVF